ncbi:MAG: polynucleotide adenylyltransferase [Blastocatellia bacterium AA13]|nr:MAG: polynucleotide adenylyltransferase [Blastocatellia bacterium AA13]
MPIALPDEVIQLCRIIESEGGRALLVGGYVRDQMLGIASKDCDIEVYGVQPDRLRAILQDIGPVNAVGERFTVYKLVLSKPDNQRHSSRDRYEVDVSLPRRETKTGRGHKGFLVEGDPAMFIQDAARRRDFTINAVLFDPLTGQTLDPFNGLADLQNRILRAVSAETFVEDSLRVLRAMQFAARFEMTIEPSTLTLCRSIELNDLPKERIWGEFEKLFTKADRPSIGLRAALELGILDRLFPEIRALVDCPQDSDLHPEGDVFTHVALSLDQAVEAASELPTEKRLAVMLAVLCHDFGKPSTTKICEGKVTSAGHDEAGGEPSRSVLNRLGLHTLSGYDVRSQVLSLVREHLRPSQYFDRRGSSTDGAIRRLACRVDIDLLYRVAKADALGRGPAASSEAPDWFISRARDLGVDNGPLPPLLLGRHLLEAGVNPGPKIGEVLRRVYELQLDEEVNTGEEALTAGLTLIKQDSTS